MSSMSSVAGLSKFITTLPKTKTSIFSMIFISFLSGALIFFIGPNYQISLLEKLIYGGTFGFGVFGISSIISGSIDQQWVNSMKGINLKLKHSMFLSLVSMTGLCFVTLFGVIISRLFNIDLIINSIIFGCVLIFAFNILVLWSTTSIGVIKSTIVAFFQPLLILAMLFVANILASAEIALNLGILSVIIKVVVASIIFLLAIYSFITVIESPMKKNLGIGLLDLLSFFIAHMNEGSHSLENLFEEVGEPIDTLISMVSFKGKKGIKSLFISPCIHPGPLGDIGGSNMPTIIGSSFDHFTMVAHGPSTHDFNPVSVKELDKIKTAINNGLKNIEYGNKASEFKRYTHETAKIGVQFFNDGMILLSTFAPNGSDDIEFSIGLTMMAQSMKKCNIKSAVVVDCHNSFTEESGRVLPGNPEVFELLDAIDKIDCLEKSSIIRVGCNNNLMEDLDKTNGVGESGIKTMIIDVNNQKTAYILYDANNMEIGFRDEIINKVFQLDIDEVEIMTTDTHSVNTISKGYNPIGLSERDKIIDYTLDSVKKALNDLEEVEVGCTVEKIKGLHTFGPNNSTELISTISSIIQVSKIIAPTIFIIALIFVILWIFH